jgi:hypothetical protein
MHMCVYIYVHYIYIYIYICIYLYTHIHSQIAEFAGVNVPEEAALGVVVSLLSGGVALSLAKNEREGK